MVELDRSKHFVAFEGLIAAGKTTLAGLFATSRGVLPILEEFANNPFLSDFYADQERWALPMQLWFLQARQRQLAALEQLGETKKIADYAFIKNRIFANLSLRGREFELFQEIAGSLNRIAFEPQVIVYLDARNEVLLERIKNRGRPFEKFIDETYLDRLRGVYDEAFNRYIGAGVVRIETSNLDLSSCEQMNQLFETIANAEPGSVGF